MKSRTSDPTLSETAAQPPSQPYSIYSLAAGVLLACYAFVVGITAVILMTFEGRIQMIRLCPVGESSCARMHDITIKSVTHDELSVLAVILGTSAVLMGLTLLLGLMSSGAIDV